VDAGLVAADGPQVLQIAKHPVRVDRWHLDLPSLKAS
jgi:hypothetical protein